MTPHWEPGVNYKLGDIVKYGGHRYKIIQPHRSQSDWPPDQTPALWERLPDCDDEDSHQPYNPPHDTGDYHGQDVKQPNDYSQHPDQTVDVPQQEQKKKWLDLDDNRKKQLEIGGGLAAGAAVLAGGYALWHKHEGKEKTVEEEKSYTWGLQAWLREAHQRTDSFRNKGPSAPTTWILVERREDIPSQALDVGRDREGNVINISRVFYEDGLQIGKASRVFQQGAVITYAGVAVENSTFEVLLADRRAVRWVPYSYQLNLRQLGARPVEGGREANGAPLYIARVKYEGGVHAAKVGEHLPAAHVGFRGKEIQVDDYEVLVYN